MDTKALMKFVDSERAKNDISLRQLEKISGVSFSGISRYLSGERQPSLESTIKLLDSLGYSLTVIKKDTGETVDTLSSTKEL